VLPEIPDDAPVELKDALAVRNAASVAGECPSCGATPELHVDCKHRLLFHAVFRHSAECGALTNGEAA
jgi:hypothetical protein